MVGLDGLTMVTLLLGAKAWCRSGLCSRRNQVKCIRINNSFDFAFLQGKSHCSSQTFLTTMLCAQPLTPSYFLLKSEPDEFSIQDLQGRQEAEWDGVRSFQARNKMRLMKKDDLAFFYHSSCKVPAIVGTMRVVREAAPDATALDPNHKGYDPKSTPENCRWDAVRVRFESIFDNPVTLQQLKSSTDEAIADMTLLRQGRLSVHEVTSEQWEKVTEMANSVATSDDTFRPETNTRKRKSNASSAKATASKTGASADADEPPPPKPKNVRQKRSRASK